MGNLQTYNGAVAWRRPEVAASSDWSHRFTPSEVAALAAAADKVTGREIVSLRAADFDLCVLDPVLAKIRADLTDGRGFALLRGLPVDDWPIARTARAYWAICSHVGQPIAQNQVGNLLGHVIDVGGDSRHPNQRAHQSNDGLAFHSDIGAEYVALLCLRTARSGGKSYLVSAAALWNELVATQPDLAETLTERFHLDRRGEMVDGQNPWFTIPVFVCTAKRLFATYNPRFVYSAQRFLELPRLTGQQKKALEAVMTLANNPGFKLAMDFQPGDIQLINNHRLLHSRAAFEDWPDPSRRRHLLRIWLCVPDGDPIPDTLYNRFGADAETGRPKGTSLPPGVSFTTPLEPPALRT